MARHQSSRPGRDRRGGDHRNGDHRVGKSAAPTFADFVLDELPRERRGRAEIVGEDLAHLDYDDELSLKQAALASFWANSRLDGEPEALVPSPRPRGYRTTSKRRVELLGGAAYLFLGERRAERGMPKFVASSLEPSEHADLFALLQAKLSEPAFALVARHLNWIVVRGSYTERAVIFNVDDLFAPLVRKLKALARTLGDCRPVVTAAFVYVDESGSDYYLEARRSGRSLDFKKLFGPENLRVRYGDLRLGFHPTSFSQVNESAVPRMLELAEELLEPSRETRLVDLYCGYGLFSLALGGRVREVIGVDAAGPSIDAAKDNARRLRCRGARFLARRVTAETVDRLPAPGPDEIVLLDPPRDGVERGVIDALAERGPRGVLHVFCSVGAIPVALAEWAECGYSVTRTVPVDMFPGTPHLEVMVHLEPGRNAS